MLHGKRTCRKLELCNERTNEWEGSEDIVLARISAIAWSRLISPDFISRHCSTTRALWIAQATSFEEAPVARMWVLTT
jgi:hypothetical protein